MVGVEISAFRQSPDERPFLASETCRTLSGCWLCGFTFGDQVLVAGGAPDGAAIARRVARIPSTGRSTTVPCLAMRAASFETRPSKSFVLSLGSRSQRYFPSKASQWFGATVEPSTSTIVRKITITSWGGFLSFSSRSSRVLWFLGITCPFERLEALLKFRGLQGAGEGIKQLRDFGCFGGAQLARSDGGDDRTHGIRGVGGGLDLGQGEGNGVIAAGGSDAVRTIRAAVMSPPFAASTTVLTTASASSCISFSASSVVLWRAPLGLPAGLPDCPLGKGLPR